MGPINKFIIYSLSMIVLPIVGYFLSDFYLKTLVSANWASIYSAIVAVLIVHCVLFSFVYQAYTEDKKEAQKKSE